MFDTFKALFGRRGLIGKQDGTEWIYTTSSQKFLRIIDQSYIYMNGSCLLLMWNKHWDSYQLAIIHIYFWEGQIVLLDLKDLHNSLGQDKSFIYLFSTTDQSYNQWAFDK